MKTFGIIQELEEKSEEEWAEKITPDIVIFQWKKYTILSIGWEQIMKDILTEIPHKIGKVAQINFDSQEKVYSILEILD